MKNARKTKNAKGKCHCPEYRLLFLKNVQSVQQGFEVKGIKTLKSYTLGGSYWD